MPKLLLRIVALLLVPALIADLSTVRSLGAWATSLENRREDPVNERFEAEALAALARMFPRPSTPNGKPSAELDHRISAALPILVPVTFIQFAFPHPAVQHTLPTEDHSPVLYERTFDISLSQNFNEASFFNIMRTVAHDLSSSGIRLSPLAVDPSKQLRDKLMLGPLSLMHVIGNAVEADFMRTLEKEPGYKGVVTIRFEKWGEHGIQCVVSDNGVGIDGKTMRGLFLKHDREFSTKVFPFSPTTLGGQGKAIYTHYSNFIEKGHGEIVFETRNKTEALRLVANSATLAAPIVVPGSRMERGTDIYLRWDHHAEGPFPDKKSPRDVAGAKKVLVVDDSRGIRLAMRAALSDDGYEVVEAESGEEALQILAREPLDLMITDWVLGANMHGPDLIQEVQRLKPEMKVLFMSGADRLTQRSTELGVMSLKKPFSIDALLGAVTQLIGPATDSNSAALISASARPAPPPLETRSGAAAAPERLFRNSERGGVAIAGVMALTMALGGIMGGSSAWYLVSRLWEAPRAPTPVAVRVKKVPGPAVIVYAPAPKVIVAAPVPPKLNHAAHDYLSPAVLRPRIEFYARKHNVDPDLIEAMIIVESHYDRLAHSEHDALGLLQMKKGTADYVIKKMKLNYKNPNLMDPEPELDVGCAFVSLMQHNFRYTPREVILGFKEGPGAVLNMRTTNPTMQLGHITPDVAREHIFKVEAELDNLKLRATRAHPTLTITPKPVAAKSAPARLLNRSS